MSNNEIRGLIEEVFDERIHSAVTRMTNERNNLDEKKDLRTKEGSKEREVLQIGIDRLDLLIEILQALGKNNL